MKKSIFIAVLGLAAVAATSSYGQGYILMSSYVANNNVGGTTQWFGTSTMVDSSFNAELLYSLTPITDSVDNSSMASIISDPNAGLTALPASITPFATGAATPGFFDGQGVLIPLYTSGNVYLEVLAFNGATYDTSAVRGRSGTFIESGLITSSSIPANPFTDLPSASFVAPVPEPTTLALAGLGGLASLVAFRRKQA